MQIINNRFYSVVVAGLVLFSSCTIRNSNDDPRVFRYNESAGITTLDPAHAKSLELMWAVDQLYDGLVELSPDLQVIPAIAKSWERDGEVWTFHLRRGVRFSSHEDVPGLETGREVVAQDVVYSLERLRNPSVASPGGWILDAVVKGGITAIDDSTVRIVLKQAFPPFLGLLTTPYASIVAPEAVKERGDKFRAMPAGTGPFKLAWWVEDVALVLHSNEDYWEKDANGNHLPYLEAVHIDFVPDMGAEYLGLIQGKYDFMSGLHPAYMEDLMNINGELVEKHQDQIRLERVPFLKTDYIGLLVGSDISEMEGHPLLDVRVRKALSLAVDREGIARNLRRNSVLITDRFIPPSMPGATKYIKPEFSLEKAKQLLKEAGFEGGEGIPLIELSTTSDYVDICAALQHGWEKLGLDIEIDVAPASVQREKVSTSQAVMFKKSWLADHADAENFLGLFRETNFSPGGPNYTHFQNDDFESWYNEAMTEKDDSLRWSMYTRMDSLIHAEMPVIPLFHDQVTHFIRNSVEGWVVSPVNRLDLRRVKKRS